MSCRMMINVSVKSSTLVHKCLHVHQGMFNMQDMFFTNNDSFEALSYPTQPSCIAHYYS